MSTSRNAQTENAPKTWEEAFQKGKAKAFNRAPNPQKRYEAIPVFPYGYTDPPSESDYEPLPKCGAVLKSKTANSIQSKSKPAKSKRAKSKLPKLKLPTIKRRMAVPPPIWAPRNYARLHLKNDYLPVDASEWQMKNLFNQIHDHFGRVGAHAFKTLGLQGILPTTRWPLPPDTNVNDTYYVIRMKETRKKKDIKDIRKNKDEKGQPKDDKGQPKDDKGQIKVDKGKTKVDKGKTKIDKGKTKIDKGKTKDDKAKTKDDKAKTEDDKEAIPDKAFVEFLLEHKNNYCVAWRILKKLSEFNTAKWCCFKDHNYLNEQEPFKGNVEITNYDSGYSFELQQVKVWTNFFKTLFEFLYILYANPRSDTSPRGNRLFQTLFAFFCEGKRFPAVERFNIANMKKKLEEKDAAVLTTPLYNGVHCWGNISDLLLLLAIVLLEDNLAKSLMDMKSPNTKNPEKLPSSLVNLFDQFRRNRTKAEARCAKYTSDLKGLHMILQLKKDEVSEVQKTASYGVSAFQRLRDNCLNLVNFNHDLILALKAREAGFQGLLGVDLAPEKSAAKLTGDNSATCTESSSGAIGGPSHFPQNTREDSGFQGLLGVDLAPEKPAAKPRDDNWSICTESSSGAIGGPSHFPQNAREDSGFQGLLGVDLAPEKPAAKLTGDNSATCTESSSGAIGGPSHFPQNTREVSGFQGLLGVDLAPEKHAAKPRDDNSSTCTESSSGAIGGPSHFPQNARENSGFQGLPLVDLCPLKIEEKLVEMTISDKVVALQSTSLSKQSRG